MLGVCLGMEVCGGKFDLSLCRTLECILCKYIPAAKREMRAVYAVREHRPLDGLRLRQNKLWVLFQSRYSFVFFAHKKALTYLSNE